MFPDRTKETIFDGHDDNGSSTESILTSLDGSDALTDLSRIVPQLPAMCYTYTLDHDTGESNFPYVSDYSEKMFGLPASDIVDDPETFVNLVHADHVNTFTASVLESMKNLSEWDHQMLMLTKSGQIIRVHGKSTPHNFRRNNPDGSYSRLTVWHGVLFDITSQPSSSRCTHHTNLCEEKPSFFINDDGKITEWSDSMSLLIGRDRNEVLGMTLTSLVYDSNEIINTAPFLSPCAQNLSSDEDKTYSQDIVIESKNGSQLRLYTTFQEKRDTQTNKLGILCYCKDVTKLRQAEEGKKAALQLLDAEKNLTEWLSHEIRNPLSIAMESSLALKELYTDRDSFSSDSSITEGIVDKEGLYFVELICRSIAYVVDLLTNALDLNKCVDGRIVLRPAICSLNNDILKPTQEMMGAWGNRVTISISGEDILIYIDKLRLKQVLMNLMTNAIKNTSKGFVHVATKITNNDVDGSSIEDSLIITVSDSGSGISEKDYPKLFTKWQQLGSKGNGAGIGLCLSRLLIEAMGAHIYLNKSYESGIEGHPGAQFVLRFPMNNLLATDNEGNAMHSVSAFSAVSSAVVASVDDCFDFKEDLHEQASSNSIKYGVEDEFHVNGRFRILIVDDDKVLRKILRRRFSTLFPQATIDEVESGEMALKYVQQDEKSYDIIFMDQFMIVDGIRGDQTIRSMRQHKIDSLIIGISGNFKAEEHISAGAQDFFQKPIPSNSIILKRMLVLLAPPRGWRVLIVDDSKINCQLLKRKLAKVASAYFTTLEIAQKHWAISICTSGKAAISLLEKEWFDLLVLDHHLGDESTNGSHVAEFSKKHSVNPDAITVMNSAGIQEKSQYIDICWGKPLPSVEKMRLDLCEKLVHRSGRL